MVVAAVMVAASSGSSVPPIVLPRVQLMSAFKRTPGHAAGRLLSAVSASVRPPHSLLDSVHGDAARFVFEAMPEDFRAGAHAEVFG